MKEWIIVGDTKDTKGCLIKIGRSCPLEQMEEELERMKTNPNKNDLALMHGCTNLRLVLTNEEDQWWNDPFLMSD